ncbi:MAG: hypothetical protein AAFX50_03835 [Acidobacteriota bacterium]
MTTPAGLTFVPVESAWRHAEARYETARARVADLEGRTEAAASSLREAQRRADDARREVELLRATVVPQLEERVLELERRLETSEADRTAAERALHATLTSTSWRLTRPLRAAMDILRGRRRPGTTTPESRDA